jgi:uncharacterized protein YhhL (DUF1145 family)
MTSRYLILLCLVCVNLNYQTCFAQKEATPIHVMEQLIQIKYNTELLLIKANTPYEKDSALVKYNIIRWQVDGLIYAIAADMITKNSIKSFNILQAITLHKRHLKEQHPYKWLEKQWLTLNQSYEVLIKPKEDDKNINLTTNVFYVIKDSWSFLEGIQKIKSDKIKIMVDLLDQTRLRPPLELLKK